MLLPSGKTIPATRQWVITSKTGISVCAFPEGESKAFWHVQQDGHNLCLCRKFKGSQCKKVFLINLFAFSEHLTMIKSLKLCRADFRLSIQLQFTGANLKTSLSLA